MEDLSPITLDGIKYAVLLAPPTMTLYPATMNNEAPRYEFFQNRETDAFRTELCKYAYAIVLFTFETKTYPKASRLALVMRRHNNNTANLDYDTLFGIEASTTEMVLSSSCNVSDLYERVRKLTYLIN